MKIFLACQPYNKITELMKKHNAKNLLMSYAFLKESLKLREVFYDWWPESLIIDSGAFSVWTKGDKIDLQDYIDFCKKVQNITPPSVYLRFVNLDVLPGKFGEKPTMEQREQSAQQGWRNMLIMQEQGIAPIHVFHQHEDFKWLNQMIDAELDYIGLSPANDASMKEKLRFLDKCFSIVKTKVKTHGFAVTSHNQVLNYPFYSVDSSSWGAGARFARTPTFKDGKVKMYAYKDKKVLSEFLDRTNKDPKLMTDYLKHSEEGIRAFIQLEQFATEVWQKRGVLHV